MSARDRLAGDLAADARAAPGAGALAAAVARAAGQGTRSAGVLGEMIADGDDYRRFWFDALHGDHPQTAGAAFETKREWNAWVKKSLQMTTLLSLPAETQRRIIDSW